MLGIELKGILSLKSGLTMAKIGENKKTKKTKQKTIKQTKTDGWNFTINKEQELLMN